MPDPFTLALLAKMVMTGIAALGIGIVVVKLLTWSGVVNWFRQRSALKAADKNNIAVLVGDALDNGHYVEVTGVFNTRTNTLLDAQQYEAEQLDADLTRLHQKSKVVIVN
jgi:hypothetical protein